MRVAAGIDLVEVDEVRRAVAVHGDRYLRHVYTEAERSVCGEDARALACAFATKEAVFKALGRPADAPRVWREIETGADGVRLTGGLAGCGVAVVDARGDARRAIAVALVEQAEEKP